MAQTVKNLPAMQETRVQSLGHKVDVVALQRSKHYIEGLNKMNQGAAVGVSPGEQCPHDFTVSPFLFSDPSFCSMALQAPG